MAELSNSSVQQAFNNYLETIHKTLATGDASEGSHYAALKALLESFDKNITATILPARIECARAGNYRTMT